MYREDLFYYLNGFLRPEQILFERADLDQYTVDETGVYHSTPGVIVFPGNTAEVSAILKYCNTNRIPVTPRGAGTGLAGNASCAEGGVLMVFTRMDKILSIDAQNGCIVVQPGCIAEILRQEVQKTGWYYPVDPASSGTSLIGGHVSTNAAGPHSYKYGPTRSYVMAMEIVLPDGTIIRTGSKTEKNSSGYNLTQLLCGSEGTLAAITEITLRLVPPPACTMTALISFPTLEDGLQAIIDLKASDIDISAMEFMERAALDLVVKYEGPEGPGAETACACHVLLDIEAGDSFSMDRQTDKLILKMQKLSHLNVLIADSEDARMKLWRTRQLIGHAVRHYSPYREVDTVVPVDRLITLIEKIKAAGDLYGFNSVCYGHGGNGNLHVNILRENKDDESWNKILTLGVEAIFREVIALGGVLSGEHGIGLLNRPFVPLQFSDAEIQLMKQVKAAFDPNGIMNPGKIFEN